MNIDRKSVLLGLLFASLLVVSRFLPAEANFSPVYALILLAAAVIRPAWFGALICGVGLLLTDIAIGFYGGMGFVYLGYLALFAIGFGSGSFQAQKIQWLRLGAASFLGNAVFFAISNFGVWWDGLIYPRTLHGLYECYVMALPFFERSMISTILFVSVGAAVVKKVLENAAVKPTSPQNTLS